ncbi:MAG: DUF2075 domain-containing protein [Mycoplasmataceae bacterium]|nr:DUF2075 domain-containing protein [Mycoplasmataceae bacterium]
MKIKVDIEQTKISNINLEKNEIEIPDLNNDMTKVIHDRFPGLYFFHNSESIYIGESNHPITRLRQHSLPGGRLKFNDKISIISSTMFNKSAVYDLETNLIDLFFADNKYDLRNTNTDQKLHNFFMAKEYRKTISPIWNALHSEGLTKSSYDSLINNATFIYSPYKKLNDKQLDTVKKIKTNLKDGITLVKGQPGTGKSILATRLLLDLSNKNGYKVALTSATANTFNNFKKVFKNLRSSINQDSSVNKVVDLCKNDHDFDVVIVDEGHRLRREDATRGHPGGRTHIKASEFRNELEILSNKYKKVIVMYDSNQSSHDEDIQNIEQTYSDKIVDKYELTEQMRSREGMEFVDYVVRLLNNEDAKYTINENYDIKIFDSFSNMRNELLSLTKQYSLVRMLSGYTRKWVSAKNEDKYDFEIDGEKLKWNTNPNNWLHSEGAANLTEVAYFHVIQGLDLHYAGIIIGNDLQYKNGKIIANKEGVAQFNQLPTTGIKNYDEELLKLITNRYKILLSRGAKGIYLYIEDKPLSEYIKSTLRI